MARNPREQALVDAIIETMSDIDRQAPLAPSLPESHAEKWTTLYQSAIVFAVRYSAMFDAPNRNAIFVYTDEEILTMWCRVRKSPDSYGCPRARKNSDQLANECIRIGADPALVGAWTDRKRREFIEGSKANA